MTDFPIHCPGCNALRPGIQEGQAIYACRSTIRQRADKPLLSRTAVCIASVASTPGNASAWVESGKEPVK